MIRFAIVFVLLSSMASAATLPVQGGEHADFTRLVVPLPDGANWDLQVMGQQAILRIEGADFHTSRTFDKIPRDRLESIAVRESALTLGLACDCVLRRSIVDRHLVIDISNTQDTAVLPVLIETEPKTLPVPFMMPRHQQEPSQIEGDLSVALARATTAGVLDAAPEILPLSRPENLPEGVGVRLANPTGISLSSVHDTQCPEHDPYDPNLWGATGDFSADIANVRRTISQELDEIDQQALRNLVRLNLFYGFPEEARQAAHLMQNHDPVLSLIIAAELGQATENIPENCSDFGAFWQFLIDLNAQLSEQTERGFMRLPDPLRGQLTPAYVSRLIQIGALSSARSVLSQADLSDRDTISLAAQLAEAMGDGDLALKYWTILAEMAPDDPQAILRVVELSNADQYPLAPSIMAIAEAAEFSWRETDVGRELASNIALAHAIAGHYREAIQRLPLIDHQSEAARSVIETFVKDAPDAEFLRLALTSLPPVIAEPSHLMVETRLRDMGFRSEVPPQMDAVRVTQLPSASIESFSNLSSVRIALDRAADTRNQIEHTLAGNDF